MTQIATVTALPAPGTAEVTVARQTACGHACDGCGRCAGRGMELVVRALTDIPLELGDRVELYSDSRVLGAAALVYLGPVVLFLLGYLLPSGLTELGRGLCGAAGFLLGLLAAVACDRRMQRRQTITYRVTRKL